MRSSESATIQEKICRLCLSDAGVLLPIFEGEVAESFTIPLTVKILTCVAIQISASDPLPRWICHRCLYEVDHFHEFRELCGKANTTLQQYLNREDDNMGSTKVTNIKNEMMDETVLHDVLDVTFGGDDGDKGDGSSRTKENVETSDLSILACVENRYSGENAVVDHTIDIKGHFLDMAVYNTVKNQKVDVTTSLINMSTDEIPGENIIPNMDDTDEETDLVGKAHYQKENIKTNKARYSCRFCSKPFIYQTSLQKHEATLHAGLSCKICFSTFSDMSELAKHEVIHTDSENHLNKNEEKGENFEFSKTDRTETFSCKFCFREFDVQEKQFCHEIYCDLNPDKVEETSFGGKIYICRYCSISFPNHDSLLSHEGNSCKQNPCYSDNKVSTELQIEPKIEEKDTYTCQYCSKTFNHRGSWWRHERIHSGAKPFVCQYCSKAFGEKATLLRHERVHLGIKPFCCGTCGKEFSDISNLRSHEKVHAKENNDSNERKSDIYTCRYCSKTFLHRGSCWRHERTHTGAKPFTCKYCPKAFAERPTLSRHERVHLGIKPFTCKVCEKAFSDVSNLRNHERIHEKSKAFLCSQCGKSFRNKGLLRKHELLHTDVRPYSCDVCNKTFVDSTDLKRHAKQHSEVRSYLCSECGKSFTESWQLKTHLKIHSEVKPYTCEVCEKSFRDISNFRAHKKLHMAGPRPFPCQHCSLSFYVNSQLKNHMRTHTGERPYKCHFCSKAFRQNQRLQIHERSHGVLSQTSLDQNGMLSTRRSYGDGITTEEIVVNPDLNHQEVQK